LSAPVPQPQGEGPAGPRGPSSDLFAYPERKDLAAKARRKAARLTNKELENKLEAWNDERAGEWGLDNYAIVDGEPSSVRS